MLQTTRNFDFKGVKRGALKDLAGKKAIVFAADRATTGMVTSPTGLKHEFMGGFFYPNQPKTGGWAFTDRAAAEKVLKRLKETGDEIGLIMIQAEDGIKGSYGFMKYVESELKHAIEKGKDADAMLEYINSKLKTRNRKGELFSEVLKKRNGKEQFDSIDDLAKTMEKEGKGKWSYEDRGAFLEKFLNATFEKEFGVPRLKWGENVKNRPTKSMLDYVNDPEFKDLEYGDVVGAIQFDTSQGVIDTRGTDEFNDHPSYPFIIKGEPLMYFNKPHDVRNIAPDFAPVSKGTNQTPLADRPKPQAARSAMGGQPVVRLQKSIDGENVNIDESPQVKMSRIDRIRVTAQDKMLYLKRLQEGVYGKDATPDDMDVYTKENISKGIINEWDRKYEERIGKPMVAHLKGLYDKYGARYDDVSRYLKAKHIVEDNIENGGIPMGEAQEIVDNFESYVPEGDRKTLHKIVSDAANFSLDRQYEGGLISLSKMQETRKMYKYYVPLRGFKLGMDYDSTVKSGSYKRKGRTSESGDPIAYLEVMAKTDIIRAEENKVKQSLFKFMQNNPNSKLYRIRNVWYIKQDDGSFTIQHTLPTKEQIDQGLATRRPPDLDNLSEADRDLWRIKHAFEGADGTLTLLEDGKKVTIEFTGEGTKIAQAIKNTNVEKMGQLMRWMTNTHAFLRKMYTQYSPEFIIRNFIRDYTAGMLNVQVDYGPRVAMNAQLNIPFTFKAIKRGLFNDKFDGMYGKSFKEFIENGAMTGYSDIKEVREIYKDRKEQVEGAINSNNMVKLLKAPMKGVNVVADFIDNTNRIVENAVRFAAFHALRQEGVSPQKAAIYAKDLTVNFNRKGERTNTYNSIFLFFNASLQGVERLLRPFFSGTPKQKARAWTTVIAAAGAQYGLAAIARAFGGEDDDGVSYYDKLPEYTRLHHIVLPNLLSEKDGDFITIPLPYGHNVLFAAPAIAEQGIMGRMSAKDATLSMVTTLMEAGSPIGAPDVENRPLSEAMISLLSPTVVKPISDIAFNRNFAGNPIAPTPFSVNAPDIPNSQNHFSSVNPIAYGIAKEINELTGGDEVTSGMVDLNPEYMEHLAGSYTGGVGKFLMNSITTGTALVRGEEFDDQQVNKVPFARNYVKGVTPYHDQARFYEIMDGVKKRVDIYKSYMNRGDFQKAKEYAQSPENKPYFMINGGVPIKKKDRWENPQTAKKMRDQLKTLRDRIRMLEDEIKVDRRAGRDGIADRKMKQIESLEKNVKKLVQRPYELLESNKPK